MPKLPYRTIVYVDGFNFYYGEVRGTPWKWLDPVALFQKVLGPQKVFCSCFGNCWNVRPDPVFVFW